ncbi:MAG: phosphoribosylamine--glycine ligase [Clostridium sp.]|nr:phosphoribosylamine--glycine ligase [Clostridium sp.]
MKVLVVGSGGREHTLVWKIAQSLLVEELYCAPGNGGIAGIAQCIAIDAMDKEGVVKFCKEKSIDMVVVAPDNPLAAGMIDALESAGVRAFGPRKSAAIIEGSKVFAKELMRKYNIPTADYRVFEDSSESIEYLKASKYPVVIKADGLAFGKGVIIAQNFEEAYKAIKDIMEDEVFGSAGKRVVIEEFLTGNEVSMLAFTDGKTIKTMVSSQDHKRALDKDQGPNTGGMGAFSPSKFYTDEIHQYCMDKIYKTTMDAMNKEGRTFKGILYFGIILTEDGPKVLEYNARFGDPETQVVLPRLKTDILEIFNAIIDQRLAEIEIEWDDNACVCVIMASGGYPGEYGTGYKIDGIAEVERDVNTVVFHAGTRLENGEYYTAGGRVLGVTSLENNLESAAQKAYEGVFKINFDGMHYRKDIGKK